jgi:seryl-tRNA synthetase
LKRKNSEFVRRSLKRGESTIEATRKNDNKPLDHQPLILAIKELEIKCAELEQEKSRILSQQNSINTEHKEESNSLRRDIKMLRDDKDRAQKRLSKALLIDGAIIALYLEVKDRSTDPPDKEPDLEVEAEKLKGRTG